MVTQLTEDNVGKTIVVGVLQQPLNHEQLFLKTNDVDTKTTLLISPTQERIDYTVAAQIGFNRHSIVSSKPKLPTVGSLPRRWRIGRSHRPGRGATAMRKS